MGLFDESVKYIQQDYAGDPRQFYYGAKRGQMVQTQSSFNQKSYVKLTEGLNKLPVDERILAAERFRDGKEKDAPFERLQSMSELERRQSGSLGGAKNFQLDGLSTGSLAKAEMVSEDAALPINGRQSSDSLWARRIPPFQEHLPLERTTC